jgi:hypothetical protein
MQLAAPPISSSGCAPNGPRDRWITDKSVTRVERSWAGLRSLAPDRTPVVGYDPQQEGLFWLAGQGGYGIQTAPGRSALAPK